MKMRKMCRLLLLLVALSLSAGVYAQPKPRWVKRGEKEVKTLNSQRFNDTYSFHLFHTDNADERVLMLDRFAPLYQYVDSVYGVPQTGMVLDSIPVANGNSPVTYTLTFKKDGQEQTVYAQRVDQFTQLDDFVTNKFEYNHYQLYAISNPGVTVPQFDDFTVTRHFDRGKALAMSIIPGLGQIYKKQNVKGWIFMGTEVALIGTLIYSTERYKHFKHKQETNDYYHNEKWTHKELMIFSAIAAGGLYVYNLFDAALCKIAPRVEISRPNSYNTQFSFGPMVTPDMISGGINVGLGMNIDF